MKNKKIIKVEGINIRIKEIDSQNYISLTDIAKNKNSEDPRFVIINWLRNRNTVEFLGIWEKIHNPAFNRIESDTFRFNALMQKAFKGELIKWIKTIN